MNFLFWQQNNGPTLLSKFSHNEMSNCYFDYRRMFKQQLNQPTADNNHLINFNLKLQNYVVVT